MRKRAVGADVAYLNRKHDQLNRHLTFVLAAQKDVCTSVENATLPCSKHLFHRFEVRFKKSRWHDCIRQSFSDYFITRVTEVVFSLFVPSDNLACVVDSPKGVVGVLQDQSCQLFVMPQLGFDLVALDCVVKAAGDSIWS